MRRSTWGDPYYVGLQGIELFDDRGAIVLLKEAAKLVWADPSSINVLPDYGSDPRVVQNLFDGKPYTSDELQSWMAPFTRGGNHVIGINFKRPLTLSMIRIWNYNGGRIHSYRGARYVEIMLDGVAIFKGDIKKAPGATLGMVRPPRVPVVDWCCLLY
jgi:hypothetical protein